MEYKILFAAGLFLVGWLWFYLFVRQILFNFMTAFPLIKNFKKASTDLISDNAAKYTWVSVITCSLVAIAVVLILAFLRHRFPSILYLEISFFVGGIVGFIVLISKLSYRNRPMYDAFCAAYYRFVPDDELRTAMYNKDTHRMKLRLRAMELPIDLIPDFKEK